MLGVCTVAGTRAESDSEGFTVLWPGTARTYKNKTHLKYRMSLSGSSLSERHNLDANDQEARARYFPADGPGHLKIDQLKISRS